MVIFLFDNLVNCKIKVTGKSNDYQQKKLKVKPKTVSLLVEDLPNN